MHEFSLLADLMRKINSIAKENNTGTVSKISIWLGSLSHISAEHFREHFEHSAIGTVAEAAELDIEESKDDSHPEAQQIILKSVDIPE